MPSAVKEGRRQHDVDLPTATATVIAMERETLRQTYDDLLARERATHQQRWDQQNREMKQLRLKMDAIGVCVNFVRVLA